MGDKESGPEKKKSAWKCLPKFALIWIAVSAVLAALFSLASGGEFVQWFYGWFVMFLAFGGAALACYFLRWILQKLFPAHFDTPEHTGETIGLIIRNILIFCGILYLVNLLGRYI